MAREMVGGKANINILRTELEMLRPYREMEEQCKREN